MTRKTGKEPQNTSTAEKGSPAVTGKAEKTAGETRADSNMNDNGQFAKYEEKIRQLEVESAHQR